MMRRSFESFFGLVSRGEKWATLPKGFLMNGPIMAPSFNSLLM